MTSSPPTAVPTSMQQAIVRSYGGPEQLLLETVPVPQPGPEEVLVHIVSAGVNPIDWKAREGHLKGMPGLDLPHVPGHDLAGVIAAAGENAAPFRVGDEVLALVPNGAFAEFRIVPATQLSRKPGSLGFEEAGALPVVALTAWQAIFDAGQLESGQTILIHGAAGGVGSLAVQLAKWKGARVIATASTANHDYLLELGADEVIDYSATRFEAAASGLDVVFDTIGGDTHDRSYQVLKPGGRLVSIVQRPSEEQAAAHQITALFIAVHPNPAELEQIAGLVASGQVKISISNRYPLSEARAALNQSQTGHTRGKIILTS